MAKQMHMWVYVSLSLDALNGQDALLLVLLTFQLRLVGKTFASV